MSINEDDGLTDEERALDAQMIAAELGPVFAPMIQAKREKAAKSGNRKKKDRRFKVNALDDAPPTSTTAKNSDEPWDSEPADATDEIRRIASIVYPYLDPRCAVATFLANANKGELILKIFDGRPQTTANLVKLYEFSRRRSKNGFHTLDGPLVDLIVSILVKEGAIQQPEPEKMSADFGDVFAEIPAVDKEAR